MPVCKPDTQDDFFALSWRTIIFNYDKGAGLSKRWEFVYQNKGECTKQDPQFVT